MAGGVVTVVTSRGQLSSCSLVVQALPGLVVCGPGRGVAVGVPPCVGGCLLPWGCGPVVCSRVWCAPSLGGACLDVCACGDDREYGGVPHRPVVRGRRERARPSRDAARSTR